MEGYMMPEYLVSYPIRGRQFFLVKAETAQKAEAKIEDPEHTNDEIDFEVNKCGKAKAVLVKPLS